MATSTNEAVVRGCQGALLVLAFLGLITNTLSLMTLGGRGMRHQASSAGLMALAIADIAVLLLAPIRYHAYYLFLSDEQFIKVKFNVDAYMQVYVEPLFWVALGVSSAVTVAVTTQRYVVIRFPFFVRRMRLSGSVGVTGFVILVLLPVALTLPHFFYYKVNTDYFIGIPVNVIVLTDFGKSDAYRCVYLQYLLPILFYLIPWIHLAVLNALLARHVRASAARVACVGASGDHGRHLTRLLIVLSLVFLLLNLPKCIVLFVRLANGTASCSTGSDGAEESPESTIEVVSWIASVLNVANSAMNFFLYCVFGERFRKEFATRFLSCRCSMHTRVEIHMQTSIKTLTTSAANNTTTES